MRLSVTQLRVAILLGNLLLTIFIAAQAVYAVFIPVKTEPVPQLPSPERLKARDGGASTGVDLVPKVQGIVQRILPPPPPPPVSLPVAGATAPPPSGGDAKPGELPPGPLDDGWEYVQGIINHDSPENSCAILQKKDGSAVQMPGAPAKKSTLSSRTLTKPSRTAGRSSTRPAIPGAGVPTDKTMVRQYDHWKDEDANPKIDVWIVEIRLDQLIYEDATQRGRLFALPSKRLKIFSDDKGDRILPMPEDVDPSNPDAKKPETTYFSQAGPDRIDRFRDRHTKDAKSVPAPGSAGPRPNLKPEASRLNDPEKQKQDLREFGKTLGDIQNSEKFKKASKAEQEKLKQVEQLLETLGKKK